MNYLVIYPGRFHPFHKGHKASYDWLTKKFGENNVYIVTSNVQAPVTSPFNYSDKVMMITKLGIPASHVVNVKNPYQPAEITANMSAEIKNDTVLVFAVSAKDAERFNFAPKKDGSLGYLQPLPENQKGMQPMTKHGYVIITPTINFTVNGADANSASEIRKMYIKGNDHDKDQVIADLYGQADPALRDVFDKKLAMSEQTNAMVAEARKGSLTESGLAKLKSLLESIRRQEEKANRHNIPLNENWINPDYIDER
jgi:hypothetical protein